MWEGSQQREEVCACEPRGGDWAQLSHELTAALDEESFPSVLNSAEEIREGPCSLRRGNGASRKGEGGVRPLII